MAIYQYNMLDIIKASVCFVIQGIKNPIKETFQTAN